MASAKNVILIIAIIIIFTLFSVYGIQLFYKEPQYSDYCKESYYSKPRIVSGMDCPENPELEAIMNDCYDSENAVINQTYDEHGCLMNFDCSTCNKDYEISREKWAKNYFIVAVIVGIIAIVIGALLFSLDVVGGGLMGGGALLIFVSSMRAWTALGDAVRFILLGLALVILIYIAIRINKGHKKLK